MKIFKKWTILYVHSLCTQFKLLAFCQIAHRIRAGVQGLGKACISLIQSGGSVQSNPKDPFAKKELADNTRHVAEKVTFYC